MGLQIFKKLLKIEVAFFASKSLQKQDALQYFFLLLFIVCKALKFSLVPLQSHFITHHGKIFYITTSFNIYVFIYF